MLRNCHSGLRGRDGGRTPCTIDEFYDILQDQKLDSKMDKVSTEMKNMNTKMDTNKVQTNDVLKRMNGRLLQLED